MSAIRCRTNIGDPPRAAAARDHVGAGGQRICHGAREVADEIVAPPVDVNGGRSTSSGSGTSRRQQRMPS